MTAKVPDDPSVDQDWVSVLAPNLKTTLGRLGVEVRVWQPRRATVAPVRVERRRGLLYVRQNRPRPGR